MPQRGPRACHFGSFWRLLLFLWDPTSTQHTKGGQKVYGQGRSMLDWSNSGARVLAIRKDPRIHQQACFAFSKPVPNTQKTDLRVTIIHLLAKSIELQACSFIFMRFQVTFPWAHATLDIPVFVEKLPPTLGEVPSLLNLLSQKTLTASLVYAQNPWWDPWWKRSQSSSCYEPECECDKRNGTFGVQKEGFKQWNEKLRRIHSVSLHSVPVQVVGTP